MSRWPPWDDYGPRIKADGIRARSVRGPIGEHWWSRRFVDALEVLGVGGRMGRGKLYARDGQVLSLTVARGVVSARVQGSRVTPYDVRLHVPVLSAKDWRRAQDAIASRASFIALLLAGEMPDDIEDAFADCRLSLFPQSPRDLKTTCTCPDVENPCKHIAAALYLLAERFDSDPFEIFRWRGKDRAELLESLGPIADRPLVPTVDVPALRERIAHFWNGGSALDEPLPRPIVVTTPHAVLLSLDEPSDLDLDLETLEAAYAAIVSYAVRLRGAAN